MKTTGGLASDKTLRDEFAGLALIAYMSCDMAIQTTIKSAKERGEEPYDFLARVCYQQADVMLKERSKKDDRGQDVSTDN